MAARRHYLKGTTNYNTWRHIKGRCYNPGHKAYYRYGGRGITMLEEWRDDVVVFCEWLDDNLGPRPEGHTLDRIHNNGGYYPGNLRWGTKPVQSHNRECFSNNTTGYKYVSPYRGGYRGRFEMNGVYHSTGCFTTPLEAYHHTLARRLELTRSSDHLMN